MHSRPNQSCTSSWTSWTVAICSIILGRIGSSRKSAHAFTQLRWSRLLGVCIRTILSIAIWNQKMFCLTIKEIWKSRISVSLNKGSIRRRVTKPSRFAARLSIWRRRSFKALGMTRVLTGGVWVHFCMRCFVATHRTTKRIANRCSKTSWRSQSLWKTILVQRLSRSCRAYSRETRTRGWAARQRTQATSWATHSSGTSTGLTFGKSVFSRLTNLTRLGHRTAAISTLCSHQRNHRKRRKRR